MSTLYSLLIGIDHYFEYPLEGGLYFPKLGGCVRDINKIYNYLTARLGVEPKNVIKLTASLGGTTPTETSSLWPTYRNIVAAFDQLTARIKPGDQLYFQYSGHGGRTRTMFPEIKGDGGLDEAIAPLDIGKPGDPSARYLRDVELYTLIERLKAKGVRLTVVIDCCHSGGITRGEVRPTGVKERGLRLPDLTTPPPADSALGDLATLTRAWDVGGATKRSLQANTSWLFEPKGYTLLSACRANEAAFEAIFQGGESNGALTYWLLDTLNKAGPNYTWKMVADRVIAKVHGQFEKQMPMLQGDGDFQIFGFDRLKSHFAVGVHKVEPSGRGVLLNAGEVHGVGNGTEFAIYAHGTQDFEQSPAKTTVQVTEVGASDSWATIKPDVSPATIEVGDQAVMINTTDVRLQRGVLLSITDPVPKAALEQAIQSNGKGFIDLVNSGQQGDFQVAFNPDKPDEYELWDSAGATIPKINPPIRRDDPSAANKLVKRLVHLARYRNAQMLDMPDPTMQQKLKVEMFSKAISQPGDKVKIVVTNQQTPGSENDAARILNITVLALSSDWSISQIYPETSGTFEPLDPGQSLPIELEAWLPDGQSESHDIIKVFATRAATQFHWLELPLLDQPQTKSSTTRSGISDPMEKMLALITADDNSQRTRAVRLSNNSQDKGWVVKQVDVVVKR